MIFDCHAYLGSYPFRPLRYNTAETLVGLMDREGIDRAAVGSLNALFFRDVQAANEELAYQVMNHQDRLTPLATLNPAYPGGDEDWHRCFDVLKMRGLVLCPAYHGYALDDPKALALMTRASERRLPIFVRVQVEDTRKQHRLVQVPNIPVEQIASAFCKLPQAQFVLLDMGLQMRRLLELVDDTRNLYADFCRWEVFTYDELSVPWLVEKLGIDHLCFGTGMPFDVPRIARVKLDALDLSAEDRLKISGGNLARLLPVTPATLH